MGQRRDCWSRRRASKHVYQCVYSPTRLGTPLENCVLKNTSISDFFQYSTEGAYAVETDDNNSELSGRKIYMSLNYLQGHPISYSDAWGARSQDGSPVVFQPKQGDKLRIISYNVIVGNSTQTVYPSDYVFDVIGVESLGDDPETNPLMEADESLEDQEFANSKQGLFLVIRDNPENDGFALSNIENNASNWFNNVIFEIFRPMKTLTLTKDCTSSSDQLTRLVRRETISFT